MSENSEELLGLTTMVVAAYVAHNNVPRGDLVGLIASTHAALAKLSGEPEELPAAPLVPAVSIKKSITPDSLICLDDGLKFKSLKRHLNSKFGPDRRGHIARSGACPADYPMVAPNYAEARSALARSSGLGRKAAPAPVSPPETAKPTKAKRATKAKASA